MKQHRQSEGIFVWDILKLVYDSTIFGEVNKFEFLLNLHPFLLFCWLHSQPICHYIFYYQETCFSIYCQNLSRWSKYPQEDSWWRELMLLLLSLFLFLPLIHFYPEGIYTLLYHFIYLSQNLFLLLMPCKHRQEKGHRI